MTTPMNVAASVKQRLLNLAKERGVEFNLLLTRYGIERFLFRLSRSKYEGQFVLKGAMLFQVWQEAVHRPTRDVDLLGRGSPELADLTMIFRDVCGTAVEEDGVSFLGESVRAERIRGNKRYQGTRIRLEGRLGVARIPLQVDVGFGDATVPAPEVVELPALLNHPAPQLRAYRRETVVAEKLHALVELGMTNTRMKDFFDLRFLSQSFPFQGPDLTKAIAATFERRRTPIPTDVPTGLTAKFAEDPAPAVQWTAFLRRSRLESQELSLGEVLSELRLFLLEPLEALRDGRDFERHWLPGGPWLERARTPPVL
jgi:predicted nucleotidyltransferase component of viral defense system